MIKTWHPPDETAAASTLAAFVEWLRATARLPGANPDRVRAWPAHDEPAFQAAIATFAGLDPSAGTAANRLRHAGPREALVLRRAGARQAWSRDALRANHPPAPSDIVAALHSGEFSTLVASVAWHLLENNTRPDDRLLWADNPLDPRALDTLTCGATLILGDTSTVVAGERAVFFF